MAYVVASVAATLGAAFSPGTPARTLTTKMNPLPSNAWTTIAALPPGNAGIITQLQIWTAGPMPAEVLFRGFFDGSETPQLGTNGIRNLRTRCGLGAGLGGGHLG